jgi:hypothetical protein
MPAESTASPRAKRETMRERLVAGGTALTEPEADGFPWLFASIGAAAAIAAVAWFVFRGGAGATATATPSGSSAALVADGSGSATAAPGSGELEPPPAPVIDPRPRQRAAALANLGQALAKDQLWATVSDAGDVVLIRSALCHDAGLTARVSATRTSLKALGYTAVRCLEQSGAVVFSESL